MTESDVAELAPTSAFYDLESILPVHQLVEPVVVGREDFRHRSTGAPFLHRVADPIGWLVRNNSLIDGKSALGSAGEIEVHQRTLGAVVDPVRIDAVGLAGPASSTGRQTRAYSPKRRLRCPGKPRDEEAPDTNRMGPL